MQKPNTQLGFTLFELLTTIAVSAILAAVAVPELMAFVANNRAATQTNEVVGALRLARNVAVTRAAAVTVCAVKPSDSARCVAGAGTHNWAQGWLVFVDDHGVVGRIDAGDAVLRAYPPLEGGTDLTATSPFIRYRADGFLDADTTTTLSLRVPRCGLTNNRNIAVTVQGRPTVSHVAC